MENTWRFSTYINGQKCQFDILDTAGDEEYKALQCQWIQWGEAFVLVYSISSRASFLRIKPFYEQIRRVKESTMVSTADSVFPTDTSQPSHIPIIIVGNHCDRVNERKVSTEEGNRLAQELGCQFFETSAKANINVQAAFSEFVRITRQSDVGVSHVLIGLAFTILSRVRGFGARYLCAAVHEDADNRRASWTSA